MIKMDMIWIATATLIHPNTSPNHLVTRTQIEDKVANLFEIKITPIMISRHLVSWKDRDADKYNPKRGGSRNRYLFKTVDGMNPSTDGDYRLYKKYDGQFDGQDKTGRIYPIASEIPSKYQYLIDWYKSQYF